MAKIDTTYQARMDGMIAALRIAKKDGVDALEKEVKFRNVNFVPLEIDRKSLEEIYGLLGARIAQTFSVMTLATLRDKFGWGEKRLKAFQEAFEEKCELVDALDYNGEHYARISDYAQMLKEECNLNVDIETILKVQEDTDKADARLKK